MNWVSSWMQSKMFLPLWLETAGVVEFFRLMHPSLSFVPFLSNESLFILSVLHYKVINFLYPPSWSDGSVPSMSVFLSVLNMYIYHIHLCIYTLFPVMASCCNRLINHSSLCTFLIIIFIHLSAQDVLGMRFHLFY